MAIHRTREKKENPHYNFLYSWNPSQPHVKREKKFSENPSLSLTSKSKKANLMAKEAPASNIKKDILRSLIIVSFILSVELVVYLAWNRFK